jgi:hypothetical protein
LLRENFAAPLACFFGASFSLFFYPLLTHTPFEVKMNKFLFVGVLLSLSVSLCVAEEWGMMVNEAIQASECEYFNAATGKYYDLSPMIRTTA